MRNYLNCLLLATMVLTSQARSEEAKPAPVWLDAAPMTGQNVVLPLEGGGSVRIDVLGEQLFRIRYSKTGKWTESALNRYGVFTSAFP